MFSWCHVRKPLLNNYPLVSTIDVQADLHFRCLHTFPMVLFQTWRFKLSNQTHIREIAMPFGLVILQTKTTSVKKSPNNNDMSSQDSTGLVKTMFAWGEKCKWKSNIERKYVCQDRTFQAKKFPSEKIWKLTSKYESYCSLNIWRPTIMKAAIF